MKKINLFCALAASVALYSYGGSDSGSSDNSDYYETESVVNSYVLTFRSKYDVYNYLNGKTFNGDGLSIAFSNNARSVSVNGTPISNNIEISDIGVNDNGVAYATVRIINPTGSNTTTFTLLAVQDNAQLIDPNDGTIYEY